MLVHDKQFIIQYVRYEHRRKKNRSIFVTWLAALETCSAQLIIDCWFSIIRRILHTMHNIKISQNVFKVLFIDQLMH